MTDRLRELGYNVLPVNNGSSAKDIETYRDIKAEIYWMMRQAFIDGKILIHDLGRLIKDISSIKYDYQSNGQMFIVSKKKMKSDGLDSPDFSDALALAFYGSQIIDGGDIVITETKKPESEESFTIVGDIFKKTF